MNDLKFNKITEDDMNLDVQGQLCNTRCFHPGYWVNAVPEYPTNACYYKNDYWDAEGAILMLF